jgi:hypothetical protein
MTDYEKFNDRLELRGQDLYWRNCGKPSRNGTLAGPTPNSGGYYVVRVDGRCYYQHRVIWFIQYGEWPRGDLDHINHNRADNRIENLREATPRENSRNKKMPADNTSGITGVCWHRQSNRWLARINNNTGKRVTKYFKAKSDAVQWRSEKEIELGYHKNHGKELAS